MRQVQSNDAPAAMPTKACFSLQELEELGYGCLAYLYIEIGANRLRAVKRGRRTMVLAEDLATWRASWPAAKVKGPPTAAAACA